jgi:hypothetical protein
VRARLPQVLAGFILAVSVATVAVTRSAVATRYARLEDGAETYALPGPDQLRVMTLGYRSAVADLIYAHLLVRYGAHFQKARRFPFVGLYLDAVTTLDPDFTEVYFYADALLTLQPGAPRQEDFDKAREVMLRGTERFPFDTRLWLTTGEYLAYLAPPHLDNPAKAQQWKLEGARLIARACELAGNDETVPYHCLGAAGILNTAGQREALIQMLTRTLAVTDDPEIREQALRALEMWVGERQQDLYARREQAFRARWTAELPHVTLDRMLLLGPGFDPWECAGSARNNPECATSWLAWSERQRLGDLR